MSSIRLREACGDAANPAECCRDGISRGDGNGSGDGTGQDDVPGLKRHARPGWERLIGSIGIRVRSASRSSWAIRPHAASSINYLRLIDSR
jgi:hypothetical protein